MVKSIISFDNLYDYRYSVKNGKILCERDDMLMEIFGTTYGLDGDRLPVFVGESERDYLEELSRILGNEEYCPIYETLGGENLVWAYTNKDTQVLDDLEFSSTTKTVRMIIHVDTIKDGRLHLLCLLAELA